jgi:PmbA protein
MTDALLTTAHMALDLAKAHGATSADTVVVDGRDTSISVRNGEVEQIEQAEAREIGIRVFVGQSSAILSGSVLSRDAINRMVEQAVAMAKLAPPDPHAGLAESAQLATTFPTLDVASSETITADQLRANALAAESAALAVKGVSKSNGAGASSYVGSSAFATSNGFARTSFRTSFSTSASVIAGEGTAMERDYDGHGAVWFRDMETAEKIGRTAGERAVRRLNPRKLESQKLPVLFDRRIATSLIGHLIGGINGAAIARGTSFLKNDRGQALFAPGVSIIDDPFRAKSLSSRAHDGEGLPVSVHRLIDKGVLTNWILDLRSARQLGLAPTGQAGRGLASNPSPTTSNLHMEKGTRSPEKMMKDIGTGLLVTEFIGSSINMVTGDYSRGASGYWIENGELAYPVSEITVAGNLRDMFKALEPADDLIFRSSTVAPTCFLGEMTIAGR